MVPCSLRQGDAIRGSLQIALELALRCGNLDVEPLHASEAEQCEVDVCRHRGIGAGELESSVDVGMALFGGVGVAELQCR
jgi:hypothetical protein